MVSCYAEWHIILTNFLVLHTTTCASDCIQHVDQSNTINKHTQLLIK